MSNNKINFTKANLNKLALPPKGKRCVVYDNKIAGFGLSITAAGTKTFIVYKKIRGKPERIHLGHYPALSLEQARVLAYETNALIARGENPNEQRRLAQTEWTLTELFDIYLNQYAKAHKKTWSQDEAQFQRYLIPWQQKKLSKINKLELQTLHSDIGKHKGQYAANRLLMLLQTLFNKAIEWGWQHPNPALGIKKFKEKSRERFLQADELPRFFQALATETNTTIKDYVWLSLLTGARKSNLLALRWQDLNLSQATWFIAETKNGTSQTIPLATEAVAILKQRQHNNSAYVFPSRSKTGHLVEPKNGWKKLLNRANINDLRLHDLRRSLGSWQASTGANLSVIGKTLNHKDLASTQIYARLNIAPVRAAMNTAIAAMLDAGQVKS